MAARVPSRVSSRDLILVGLLGLAGVWPLFFDGAGSESLLVWMALIAAPVGWLAAGLGLRLWPVGWAIPCSWAIPVVMADAGTVVPLPSAPWAAMAWCGLFATGFGAATIWPGRAWAGAAGLFALAALASGVLTLGGLGRGGSVGVWGPATGARLLDLSPVVLLGESAGLDWMRHPSVYRTGGTAHMGPEMRSAWQGSLAGPGALVFGCIVLALGRWRSRRHTLRPSQASTPPADKPAD